MDPMYRWLSRRARRAPEACAFMEWRSGGIHRHLTHAELLREVDATMAGLRAAGVDAGCRVVVAMPNEISFVSVLVASNALGAVAVPAPTPNTRRGEAFRNRLAGIVEDCTPTLIVTTDEFAADVSGALRAGHRGVPVHRWEALLDAGRRGGPSGGGPDLTGVGPIGDALSVAVLQYTSGSTGRPRGVVVTNQMCWTSCRQAAHAYQENSHDVAVTWVPLYHDMGLVTGVLRPLFSGYPSVLMHPHEFAAAPRRWLDAITACRATVSSAPNFAYELCVRKVDTAQVPQLDLSRWRIARNAGEVVSPGTMDRFASHFAPAGLRRSALCPSYGMAEATLTVTTCGPAVPPLDLAVRVADLDRGAVATCDDVTTAGPVRRLLSSGVPMPRTDVTIASARGAGAIGEVLVRGPQFTPGYWPAEQPRGVPGWRRTGDLGFLRAGHLFVLGRIDDTIVVHGRNHYLHDITTACADVDGVRPGRVAAVLLGADPPTVHLVAEVDRVLADNPRRLRAMALELQRRLAHALELFVTTVHFLAPGGMPVTTSGKVRVAEVRRRLSEGEPRLLRQDAASAQPDGRSKMSS